MMVLLHQLFRVGALVLLLSSAMGMPDDMKDDEIRGWRIVHRDDIIMPVKVNKEKGMDDSEKKDEMKEIIANDMFRSASDGDEDDVAEEDDDDLETTDSESLPAAPLFDDDYYYDYDYPMYDYGGRINDTDEGVDHQVTQGSSSRQKRLAPLLQNQQATSNSDLGGGKLIKLDSPRQPANVAFQKSLRQLKAKIRADYLMRQMQQQRQQQQQQTKVIVRPAGALYGAGQASGGNILQSLLAGSRGRFTAYSPSQQPLKTISATLNPSFSKFQLQPLETGQSQSISSFGSSSGSSSTQNDVARVLYLMSILSKLQSSQKSETVDSNIQQSGISFGSGTSGFETLNQQIGSYGSLTPVSLATSPLTQQSQNLQIATYRRPLAVRRIAVFRLVRPLVRFVSLMKSSPQINWETFLNQVNSKQSTMGYQAIMQQIRRENMRQRFIKKQLNYWRQLATTQKNLCGSQK